MPAGQAAALGPTHVSVYDLMVERYFRSVGFLSAGAFYKDLQNFIFATARARRTDEALGPDATQVIQPVNGPTAKLYGFEVAWQQNLTFLPGILSGLGLNANYTYTRSIAEIPGRGRDGVDTPLPGQGHEGHIALITGLKPDSGTGRNIQPPAASLVAIEAESRIHLKKVKVRPDLNGAIARIGHRQRHHLFAGIQLDFAVGGQQFSGNHVGPPRLAIKS